MHTVFSIALITSEASTAVYCSISLCRVARKSASAMRRENTFKIDYSQFSVKPSIEKLYGFCRSVLGLKREDIKRLQGHRGGQCAFVKVSDLALAQKVVDEHDGKHEVECDGKKHKLRITLEDGSVEVRVYDLPEAVPEEKVEEKVANFLSAYGEVISIREVLWGESNESEGIPLGVWSARMLVKRNIDSWVTIDGEQAFVVYKGQLQSCRHCKEQSHTGISCVQNKKLLFQKSYANVTKQTGQATGSTTGHQPKKPAGVKPPKPPSTKPVGKKPPAPSPTSSNAFPELPNSTTQRDPKTHTSSQPAAECVQNSSTSFLAPPQAVVALQDIFKKPPVTRSQSKSDNGNETDESSTSTSSKRSRGRPAGKKPRRDSDGGEEEEERP